MPDYTWPKAEDRKLIGKYHDRLDGPAKSTGAAKYAYDQNPPGLLHGAYLRCPHGAAVVESIDASAAEKMPGVKKVLVVAQKGANLAFAGAEVALVVADTEERAEDAARSIKVSYKVGAFVVREEDLDALQKNSPARVLAPSEQTAGKAAEALKAAEIKSNGKYGAAVITHCCLEPHGSTASWNAQDKSLTAWLSTQNVNGTAGEYAGGLKIPRTSVKVLTEVMGGGFGSKFGTYSEGMAAARLSQELGAPVKLLLSREGELKAGGCRPSHYARISVGGSKAGLISAWESQTWGIGGSAPMPYVFVNIPNRRHRHFGINVNHGPVRAWRAPNHPAAAVMTMGAVADFAAACGVDELACFKTNAELTARAQVYRDELDKAAELIGWKAKWHPRGDKTPGPIKRGLGVSMHTWGGGPVVCDVELIINPDGSVETRSTVQDLGTGTRTVIALVAAESLGLTVDAITSRVGNSQYVPGNGSGGSITVGSVSSATRRAALDAFEKLAAKLGMGDVADLKATDGKVVNVKTNASVTWKQACGKLGMMPVSAVGKSDGYKEMPKQMTSAGVGGVQVAEVAVDVETGLVRVTNFVAVQDCGLIINMKCAESQVHGGVIQGISSALCEERVMDPATGDFINSDMANYKLAGLADVGSIKVHMMTGKGYDERGVVGLGEPPVISTAAAVANAVANAIGVRVGTVPLTADRVLAALKGGA